MIKREKMKSKKAQIKMGETMAILVIFFFLLVIGMSFYVKVQKFSIGRQVEGAKEMEAIQIAQKASFMPELQCSFKNIPIDNCYDISKILFFRQSLDDQRRFLEYTDVFGNSEIWVEELYPTPGNVESIFDNPLPGYVQARLTRVPISLYNPRTRDYSFGILYINITSE